MGSSKKIITGFIWTSLLNLTNAVYGFIAVPLLISHFGKSEYGLIGLAMSINVYMRLMDMGFNSTNIRFFSAWLAEHKIVKLQRAFRTSLSFYGIIGLLNGLILLFLSFYSDKLFKVTETQDIILKHLLIILSLSAFFNWISSCFDQLIKATENVAWIQKRQLLPRFFQILVLFSTIYFDFSIELYYFLTCLATIIIIPISARKIKIDIKTISFIPIIDKQILREMLPYCLNIFSFSIFQFSFHNLQPIFLGMEASMADVADYRVLNALIGIINMFGGTFIQVLLPSTSKAVANQDRKAYYRVAYDGTRYISIILCFCIFGMISVAPEIICIYVGSEYLYLLPWLTIWLLFNLGNHNQGISSLILSGTDIRALTYSSMFSSTVGLLFSWFLIPDYKIGGVVIGCAIYATLQILFYYFYYWPKVMLINSKKVFISSFSSYVMIGLSICVCLRLAPIPESNLWLSLIYKSLLFAMIYCIVIFAFLRKDDKDFLRNVFVSLKNR